MDNVYDNLENYDDLQKIEELKNENKELRCKIEKYTSDIEELQKDFDYLAAEHKKLEQNYSSLLKTAKSEIERKTHMITELNIEKDKLVINARQNHIKNRFNRFIGQKHKFNTDKKPDTGCSYREQEQVEVIKKIQQKDSKIDVHLPSTDSPTCNADDVIEAGNNLRNKKVNSEDTRCKSKENDTQLLNKHSKRDTDTVVKKITNRRKSMPMLNHDMKFNTDEECQNNNIREENKMEYKQRDEAFKHSSERNSYNNKIHEASSNKHDFNNHQKFLPGNYSRYNSNLYYNNDKYRSRDQYLSSQRQRESYSSDFYYRGSRVNKDDYYQRYDYNNQRAHKSPPREQFYQHSRSTEYRPNYSRDCSRDFYRGRNDRERYAEKHKYQNDLDEPSCKRQRNDYGYKLVHEERWQKEIDCGNALMPAPLEDTEHYSCQSPDSLHSDYYTCGPIKEIRSTAIMQLDDPRLSSKKYKTMNDNGKEVLSTVIGSNVDIIPVKKSVWGFKPVPIPRALLEPPPDDVIICDKIIDNKFDRETTNTSKDSREILYHCSDRHQVQSCDDSVNSKNYDKGDSVIEPNFKEYTEVESIKENNQNNMDGAKLICRSTTENDDNNICVEALSSGCKIPKLQYNFETSASNAKTNDDVDISCKELEKKDSNISDMSNSSHDSKSMPQLTTCAKYSDVGNKYDDVAISLKIVEADLVLSDDPSEIMEPQKQTCKKQTKSKWKKNKTEVHSEKKFNESDQKICENPSKVFDENVKFVKNIERRLSGDKDKVETMEKSPRQVKKTRKITEENHVAGDIPSKVTKTRKSKKEDDNTTKKIKTKFCDLFGDSNSLITPDDLGIVTQEEPKAKEKFVTILDDTQDAVDLNFKEMEEDLTNIDNSPNDPVKDQSHSAIAPANCVITKEIDSDDHELKKRPTAKEKPGCNEIRSGSETHKNLCQETDDVNTIIISTGKQSQFDVRNEPEPAHLQDVASVDNLEKPFEVLEAVATSTPAKVHHEQTTSLPLYCSNTDSTNSRVDDSLHKVNHDKDSDVPDVRIFVKRRRKAKKV